MSNMPSELPVGGMMPMTEPVGSGPVVAQSGLDILRVLLVDDNAHVLQFLTSAFKMHNCLVSTAAAAEQALDLLSDTVFDLIVSDIKMPGLSGLDLLRAVKSKQPGTPVVLMTGVPSINSAVFGLRHGAYDYLPKPFSVKEVQQLIQRLRKDRQSGHSQMGQPAGLMEELARRQTGMEGLFKIGELALQGLDPGIFVDTVLDFTIQSLRGDAALLLLRDHEGNFTPNQKGDTTLVSSLLSLLHSAFNELVQTGGKEALTLTTKDQPYTALAALIPGVGKSMGILCLGRDARNGAFLPDEKEFLLGYAQTTALALQRILLRENLESNLIDTISSFVNALESKDLYLKGHSARVSLYAGEIAGMMGLSPLQVFVTRRAGILHDLGKLVILDSILHKPGRLTKEEYALITRHPLVAYKILKPLRFLANEAEAIKYHHERYDGKGYPDGLKGEEIPLPARIVTVADSFDAMTSTRPYRSALPHDVALAEVLRGKGIQFDPRVIEAFGSIPRTRLAEISRYYDARATAALAERTGGTHPAGEVVTSKPGVEVDC
jgi:response regulator RpfG family c-di-GMP phosphodiesterase